jgi:BMFP domain-containing protein YqiC
MNDNGQSFDIDPQVLIDTLRTKLAQQAVYIADLEAALQTAAVPSPEPIGASDGLDRT